MHWLERMLLYATSAVLAVVLVLDHDVSGPADPPRQSSSNGAKALAADTQTTGIPPTGGQTTTAQPADSPDGKAIARRPGSLVLVDSQGRRRIELDAENARGPRIILSDANGKPQIVLTAGPNEQARLVLRGKHGQAELQAAEDGGLAFQLTGAKGAKTQMTVTADGASEIAARAADSRLRAVLRTDEEGAAEVAVVAPQDSRGPKMSLLPEGEAAIAILDPENDSGPIMQLFQDGLAEIAIRGRNSKSGPAMLQLVDGVSVVSTRLPNGQPGASLVTAPDGTSVIAASNADGTKQAALRIDRKGNPTVYVTDPAGNDGDKPPKAAPKIPAPPSRTVLNAEP